MSAVLTKILFSGAGILFFVSLMYNFGKSADLSHDETVPVQKVDSYRVNSFVNLLIYLAWILPYGMFYGECDNIFTAMKASDFSQAKDILCLAGIIGLLVIDVILLILDYKTKGTEATEQSLTKGDNNYELNSNKINRKESYKCKNFLIFFEKR